MNERVVDTERGMTVEEMAEAQRRFLASIPGPLYDLRDDEFAQKTPAGEEAAAEKAPSRRDRRETDRE